MLILVDGGSTHNFIQDTLVSRLGLSPCDTTPLKVMVGNGQYLHCQQLCPTVPVMIQNIEFTIDLHILPLCGANLVLGVQWLRSLGPILTDYTTLSMKFLHQGRIIKFKGEDTSILQPLSPTQVRLLVRTAGASAYFHITLNPIDLPSSDKSQHTPLPAIQSLLTLFASLFQTPQALLPSQPTDHHIQLAPNSDPVHVRPYRYLHYQKSQNRIPG